MYCGAYRFAECLDEFAKLREFIKINSNKLRVCTENANFANFVHVLNKTKTVTFL